MDKPWRWINAGKTELGQWVLDMRQVLETKNGLDTLPLPDEVNLYQMAGRTVNEQLRFQANIHYELLKQINPGESILVIGDSISPQSRHNFARTVNGIDVVEPVDLRDVMAFCSQIASKQGLELLDMVLKFIASMMTGANRAQLIQRTEVIIRGKNRKEPTPLESAAVAVTASSDKVNSISNLLDALECEPSTRLYRKQAHAALREAFNLYLSNAEKSLGECVASVRERRRHYGDKRISQRAIGSTLLLKGLEADHVLILNTAPMSNKDLYVAISRGAQSVTAIVG
jgi:DNA helicase-2/ATP-dependent DNA helicase PcrA